tara:strand:+ start:6951 stop:8117 length:1167 start_codon:yes stop_codon:yes gene_type:complete
MDRFKKWLWAISSCSIFVLFGPNIGFNTITSMVIVFMVISYPFFRYTIISRIFIPIKNHLLIHIVSLILIFYNIILSIDPLISFQYWISYLVFIYGFNSWLIKIKRDGKYQEFLSVLKKDLKYYMFFNLMLIYFGLTFLGFGSLKTYNTFGIMTGSVVVYFWFLDFKNVKIKMLFISVLIYFLLVSLSRSSLIFAALAILTTELILFKKSLKRKFLLLIGGVSLLLLFRNKLFSWFSEKQTISGSGITEISDLASLNDDRYMLIQNFLKTYQDNFFTGYGIKSDYNNLSEWNAVDNIGVHNGILDMLLVVGIPLSLIFIYYFFKSFRKLIKMTLRDKSNSALLGFVFYCLIRSYGESYFLINTGNQMSIFFILILIVTYNTKKKQYEN